MKEYGGYFEIEFSNVEMGIHPYSIKLNTARNCFEYILLAKQYKNIYIPYYTCEAIIEPLKKHQVNYTFYYVNEYLEPITIPALKQGEALLYTNYFGLKDAYIKQLKNSVARLIIDNSQALFAEPIEGIDTFYSLRKFVGVPDGAFLYSNTPLESTYQKAVSSQRISHLYQRKDSGAEAGYAEFKKNDDSLSHLPLMSISPSTESFIRTYDFAKNKFLRERNFLFLHSLIGFRNKIKLDMSSINGPLCYPFLTEKDMLKEKLIKRKVFSPLYWPNVADWLPDHNTWEAHITKYLAPLPIDHRYSLSDIRTISEILLEVHEED